MYQPDHDFDESFIRVLSQITRQAIKHHRCDNCGYGIEPGEKYDVVTLTEDGVFRVEKHHLGKGCSLAETRARAEEDQNWQAHEDHIAAQHTAWAEDDAAMKEIHPASYESSPEVDPEWIDEDLPF